MKLLAILQNLSVRTSGGTTPTHARARARKVVLRPINHVQSLLCRGLRANRDSLSIKRVESPFCNLDRRHGARTLFRLYTGRQTSDGII